MAIAGALMAGVMIGLSCVQTGWQLVLLFLIQGMIGMQGAGGNLFQSVPIARWFIRMRGKAMSITFLGTTAGIFIFSPLIQYTISALSWRHAWIILGGGSSLIIMIIGITIIRKEPASMGLLPDGDTREIKGEVNNVDLKKTSTINEYAWTRQEAVKTFAFWALIAVMGLRMFSMSSINIFRIPFYIERGVSPQLVAWALSAEAVVSAIVAIPTGWIVDRIKPRFVMAASLALFTVVVIVTLNVRTTWHVYVAAMLFGVSAASFLVAQNTLWPNYFGGRNIGSIRGFAMPITIVFSAIGGPIAGFVKDSTGTYSPVWILSAVFLSIASIIMLFTLEPIPPEDKN
jgi:MFS family permease